MFYYFCYSVFPSPIVARLELNGDIGISGSLLLGRRHVRVDIISAADVGVVGLGDVNAAHVHEFGSVVDVGRHGLVGRVARALRLLYVSVVLRVVGERLGVARDVRVECDGAARVAVAVQRAAVVDELLLENSGPSFPSIFKKKKIYYVFLIV